VISTALIGRVGYVGAVVLAFVAAILAAFSLQTAALTLVCLAAGLLSLAVWISNRRLSALINGRRGGASGVDQPVLAAVHEVAAQLRDLPIVTQQTAVVTQGVSRLEGALLGGTNIPGANSELARIEALAQAEDKRHRSLQHRFDLLETELQQTPGLTLELDRLSRRLDAGVETLPVPGGWALSAETLIALINEVVGPTPRQHVVECGSGTSTVWIALAMRQRGSGHVTALEHDLHFADQTRAQLRAQGLEAWATVLDAPLTEIDLEGRTVVWFDTAAFASVPASIDLLFVDGPPGTTGPLARHPAYPLLASRLADGGVVVLDDTNRADERETADDWLSRTQDERQLVVRTKVGRSTVFDVRTGPGRHGRP
jgi:predicted O-methyltransferase YrrM